MAFAAKRRYSRKVHRDGLRLSGKSGIFYGTVEDLSRGGFKVRLDSPVPVGERVDWDLSSPGWSPVKGSGVVVRCVDRLDGAELGIQFDPPSESFQQLLASLVDVTPGNF